MTSVTKLLSLLLAGVLTCNASVAETKVCMGGDLDHLSSAEKVACNAGVQTVRTALATVHAPKDWHFVVVCGKEGWAEYVAYAGDVRAELANARVSTNMEQHETFLRGDSLTNLDHTAVRQFVSQELDAIQRHFNGGVHSSELATGVVAERLPQAKQAGL